MPLEELGVECGGFTGPGEVGDTWSKVDVTLLRVKRIFGGLIVGKEGTSAASATSGSSFGPNPSRWISKI